MNSRDFEHTTDGGGPILGTSSWPTSSLQRPTRLAPCTCQNGKHGGVLGAHDRFHLEPRHAELQQPIRRVALDVKSWTKEIGYTTYYGKFGGGIGLNTRREAEEVRYVGFERQDGAWSPVEDAVVPAPDNISGDFASLFRASMIVGLGSNDALQEAPR